MTLEQELIELFDSTPSRRNRDILIGYYGWDDGRTHTLTEIGDRFGITRERVRQICAKLTKRLKNETISVPALDRGLKLIARLLPSPAARIEAQLAERGLTAIGMTLETLAAAVRLLGRPTQYEIVAIPSDDPGADRRLAVRPNQAEAVSVVVDLAKKEAYFHGLTTVEQIARAIDHQGGGRGNAELVRQTIELVDGLCWLDRSAGWFCFSTISRHGLPKTIDKVLAVAGTVTVDQLHEALSRNRRLWKVPPPKQVLLAFCRQMEGVRVERGRIVADPPRDWKKSLTGVEAKLVAVLKKRGPLMERGEMEDICVRAGMNRFSFHAFVSWSPVIAQYGHSVYGLLGTEVSSKQIERLASKRRTNSAGRRVLDGHGRTPDGKIWLRYRLSKAASTYAVITIPAALKGTVRGRYKFLNGDGEQVGTLATKDGRAWGLGAFLRNNGARIGDRIRLVLDQKSRTATVEWEGKGERGEGRGGLFSRAACGR